MGARCGPTEPSHRRTRRGDHGNDLRRRFERRLVLRPHRGRVRPVARGAVRRWRAPGRVPGRPERLARGSRARPRARRRRDRGSERVRGARLGAWRRRDRDPPPPRRDRLLGFRPPPGGVRPRGAVGRRDPGVRRDGAGGRQHPPAAARAGPAVRRGGGGPGRRPGTRRERVRVVAGPRRPADALHARARRRDTPRCVGRHDRRAFGPRGRPARRRDPGRLVAGCEIDPARPPVPRAGPPLPLRARNAER